MMKRTHTALATLSVALLAVTGCAGTAEETDPAPTESAQAISDAGLETLIAAGGGTTGAAGAEEIKIGWVNADTGPGSTPEITAQTDAAIELINTQLGGAGGSTIVLDKCEVTSEESGLECGQKFANDDEIIAVLQGNIATGSASFHSVMDASGIPIIGALPLTGEDGMAPNGYYTAPGSFSTVPAVLELVGRYLQPKSVAVITVEGEVVSTQIGTAVAAALRGMGRDVKQAAIELSATDVTAPLVAAGVQDADLIIPLVILPPQCIAVDAALQALATDATVLALAACQSIAVKEALGDYPAWTYLAAYPNPDVESADAEVQAQLEAYKEWYATLPAAEMDGVIPLQGALTLQRHLNEATEPSREAVGAAAAEWTGPVFLGSPIVAYGSVMTPIPLPALPSLATRAYAYDGDGGWTDVTDGAWLGLSQ
ncbi:ABC transporter substrate-binding protein [Microbacterium yannicii]|uniref:ABC transporter substrate-binding protein n=1 Tax=Microbacterium yannicii TaxID=671622 RepID=UPI0002FB9246|nr:ABC transporter substrate-binding protein [Microbacterium yannicii]